MNESKRKIDDNKSYKIIKQINNCHVMSLQMYKYYQNTANASVPESGPAKITAIM